MNLNGGNLHGVNTQGSDVARIFLKATVENAYLEVKRMDEKIDKIMKDLEIPDESTSSKSNWRGVYVAIRMIINGALRIRMNGDQVKDEDIKKIVDSIENPRISFEAYKELSNKISKYNKKDTELYEFFNSISSV